MGDEGTYLPGCCLWSGDWICRAGGSGGATGVRWEVKDKDGQEPMTMPVALTLVMRCPAKVSPSSGS